MSFLNWFKGLFTDTSSPIDIGYEIKNNIPIDEDLINPANCLPMIGGMDGLDVEGNPFGIDSSDDQISISSGIDDYF